MEKALYKNITHFKKVYMPNENVDVGFIIKADSTIEILKNDTVIDLDKMQELVGGYIEVVSYINDENYGVIVDKDGIIKGKKFNLLALVITGHELFGDVLVLKKQLMEV